MARCSCATSDTPSNSCMCLLEAGDNITVTGSGQALDPWVISTPDALIDTEVYTASGTWDPADYPGATKLRVRAVGGGGGSASTGATLAGQGIARGGGGGGTYIESWLDVAALPPGVVTVTVGAGGTAGSPAGTPTAGGTGGASSFGAAVSAPGGLGSGIATAPGVPPLVSAGGNQGAGGTFTVPGLSVQGSPGTGGLLQAVGVRFGGAGGAAGQLSADGVTNYVLGVGIAGRNYGGGASGSVSDGAAAGQLGSAGAPGIVIVEVFG